MANPALPPSFLAADPGGGGESVDQMRSMFGTPRIALEPVLHGSQADELVSNPRIAIVDDEPINIKVVRKFLTLAGYGQFFTTTDATRALALVEAERPDVVLLDVMMPEVSGLEILGELRKSQEHADLPVIILTASSDRETKLEALRLGATEFLGKPVDSVELEARLHNVLVTKAHQDRVKSYAWELELEVAVRSTELAQAHAEVIECLAQVGEHRDNETGNHVMRVGRYAEIVARRLGLSRELVGRIAQAAPLHDIGKVGIPDAILLKPGKLDEAEFEQMKEHCRFGQQVCSPRGHGASAAATGAAGTSPILAMAATIAVTHHEKWDGSGYPHGLAGEAIPIEGRITAVADVFDALTSQRPYKAALPFDESVAVIESEKGRHFDPPVVEAFLAGLDEIARVHRECSDAPEATVR